MLTVGIYDGYLWWVLMGRAYGRCLFAVGAHGGYLPWVLMVSAYAGTGSCARPGPGPKSSSFSGIGVWLGWIRAFAPGFIQCSLGFL